MTKLAIDDDEELDRAFRASGFGGLLSGVVAAVLVAVAGGATVPLTALSFGGITGLAATFLRPADEETPLSSVILGLGGGAVAALGTPLTIPAAFLGGAAIGLGVSVPESVADALRTGLCSGAAFGAAVFTTGILFEAGFLGSLDLGGVREPLTGAIWGTFLAAGIGIGGLRVRSTGLADELDETLEEVGESAGRYLESARELYGEIRRAIEAVEGGAMSRDAERILEAGLRELESLARRSDELRGALEIQDKGVLEERRAEIDQRLESTDDGALRRELEAARAEMARQSEDRDRLEEAVARIDVRQQRCLSALRRLNVVLVEGRGGAESERRLDETLEELGHLTDRVHWRNLTADEICNRRLAESGDRSGSTTASPESGEEPEAVDGGAGGINPHDDENECRPEPPSVDYDDAEERRVEARGTTHALDGE